MDSRSRRLSSANLLHTPSDLYSSHRQMHINEQLMHYEQSPPPQIHHLVHRAELLAFRARHSSGSLSPLYPNSLENRISNTNLLDGTKSRYAFQYHETKLVGHGNENDNCVQWERAPPLRRFVDGRCSKVHRPREADRIGVLERLLKVLEERCQRECSAKTAAEERLRQLEQELWQLHGPAQLAGTKNSELSVTRVEKDENELNPSVDTAYGLAEQSRIQGLERELEKLRAHLSSAIKVRTDSRIEELEREVKSLQGQLALQKAAVQVEQGQLNKLAQENGSLRTQLDQHTAVLRTERLKIKVLADREAERSNKDPQERVRIAQEKLRVMSEALSEEREKSRKFKEMVTATRAQLNAARKEANERHFTLELQVAWQERARATEQRDYKRVKDQLSLAHAIIDSKRENPRASRAKSA